MGRGAGGVTPSPWALLAANSCAAWGKAPALSEPQHPNLMGTRDPTVTGRAARPPLYNLVGLGLTKEGFCPG